jgi:hypothetical protein
VVTTQPYRGRVFDGRRAQLGLRDGAGVVLDVEREAALVLARAR